MVTAGESFKITGAIVRRTGERGETIEEYNLTVLIIPRPAVRITATYGTPIAKGTKLMPTTITDQQLVVGTFAELDALGLPADDAIASVADWTVTDVADAGTDVTVVSGDASSGTSDGNLNTFTVQATGTGEGEVTYSTTVTTTSGATLSFSDTAQVNGGAATSISATYASPEAIPGVA